MTRALTLLAAILAAGLAEADPAFGYWRVENGRAIIEVHPCGRMACGRIAWLSAPFNPDGSAKTDMNNPDPMRRHRTLCGLPLISGLDPDGPGAWVDGEIYNARDGSVYSVKVTLDGPETLEVRGFLGISLLGRSQIWRREGGDRGGCSRLDRPGLDR